MHKYHCRKINIKRVTNFYDKWIASYNKIIKICKSTITHKCTQP